MKTPRLETEIISGRHDTDLYCRRLRIPAARLQVVISHGLGEHSGRYGHIADALVPMGASLWIHDHRGHGRSQGKRGHVDDFSDYVADLKTVIERARADLAGSAPLLLLGHSMGGLVALSLARQHPQLIDGLIVSSPLLDIPRPPHPVVTSIVRMMAVIWPSLPLSNRVDATYISHDKAEVKAYQQSDLVHNRISARWAVSGMREMAATAGAASAIRTPILMQIAGADKLVSAPAALAYFESLTVADKTLCHYPDLYHEIYNEKRPERDQVLDDLKEWIEKRFL